MSDVCTILYVVNISMHHPGESRFEQACPLDRHSTTDGRIHTCESVPD